MRPNAVSVALATLLFAATASAGTFIVPADEELVAKSAAVVTGTVEGSFVQATETTIETINEIRIERTIKGRGLRDGSLVRVVTLGGVLEDGRGLLVPGEAQFHRGERVLLFLTEDDGRWRATDLTLGKFKFVTSTTGDRLLVRDMEDVVGWDRAGRVHREKIRREEAFLQFVEERAKGRPFAIDYLVEASEVTIAPDEDLQFAIGTNAAPFPGATYTSWVNNQPNRWPNMANGITFYKRSDQNIAGAADGGVSAIQSGLAAWTNECGSAINLGYGGQAARGSANHDGANMVEYNDPQGRVGGSWGGSGTIAITFISFAGEHSFEGRSWLNITDADVVFQDGYPATNAAFPAAMTHELGHGLGFRHSNQNHATGGACNPGVEECTSAAIMNSSVSGNYGYTLQPWDINAAQSVYPGGTCGPVCSPPVITGHPQSQTVTPGTQVTLSVAATGTGGPFTYQWYIGTSGNTANPIPSGSTSSITVTPGTTTSYWVRVTSSCGSANSNTATISVTQVALAAGTAARLYLVTPCRVIDTRGGPPNYSQNAQLVQVTGRCGIPSGAKSVVLNIAAVAPSANGYLIVYPGTGGPPPGTSTLSYRANRTRANNSVMRLSSDGRLSVYNGGPPVHFLIDVTGYFQ
ncbi:MAG TPA: immunoglobulin domain-containing protein [Thermoanaerobaculia bacterium]